MLETFLMTLENDNLMKEVVCINDMGIYNIFNLTSMMRNGLGVENPLDEIDDDHV